MTQVAKGVSGIVNVVALKISQSVDDSVAWGKLYNCQQSIAILVQTFNLCIKNYELVSFKKLYCQAPFHSNSDFKTHRVRIGLEVFFNNQYFRIGTVKLSLFEKHSSSIIHSFFTHAQCQEQNKQEIEKSLFPEFSFIYNKCETYSFLAFVV